MTQITFRGCWLKKRRFRMTKKCFFALLRRKIKKKVKKIV